MINGSATAFLNLSFALSTSAKASAYIAGALYAGALYAGALYAGALYAGALYALLSLATCLAAAPADMLFFLSSYISAIVLSGALYVLGI